MLSSDMDGHDVTRLSSQADKGLHPVLTANLSRVYDRFDVRFLKH